MNQDYVARFNARLEGIHPVGAVGASVVGRHQAVEIRLQLGAGEIARIDVIHRAVGGGFWHWSRAGSDSAFDGGGACGRIRISELQPHAVFSVRCQIENAAGKHVGRHVVKRGSLQYGFALQTKQRQAIMPRGFTCTLPGERD